MGAAAGLRFEVWSIRNVSPETEEVGFELALSYGSKSEEGARSVELKVSAVAASSRTMLMDGRGCCVVCYMYLT